MASKGGRIARWADGMAPPLFAWPFIAQRGRGSLITSNTI